MCRLKDSSISVADNYWPDLVVTEIADGSEFGTLRFTTRKERFITRIVGAPSDPRVNHEVCTIWISYWSRYNARAAASQPHDMCFETTDT
ncbi:catalase 2 [Artemisia annua]|uniref:Catalase 2 n=1 Tax=Artemisia annua TaxID=35608 RepID=A0A2U1N1L9_ARTAN|nr:catalase 2 [Artemisia annua]